MSLKSALRKIRSIPDLQKRYNIFINVDGSAEDTLKKETNSDLPLSNLVAGIKDNIVTKGMPTTCGSSILSNYYSPYTATCVQKLCDSGVTIAGKTNLDEFGMGSGGVHSHFGPVLNPLFPKIDTIAGGSSSGSAAAVAADAVDFALGTDTGGSVRLPAAYTSILGFKPSYGRISRYGVVAYAQSLDTVGILAKDFSILRRVFNILDAFDSKDPTSLSEELRSRASKMFEKKSRYRIGIPHELIQNSVSSHTKELLYTFIKRVLLLGHEIYPVSIPSLKDSLPIYYTLSPAEAVSNLSRFDGVRYGTRDIGKDVEDGTLFAPTRSKFGREVQDRIILGNYNLCSHTFKNNYIKAQKLRVKLINNFDEVFRFPNVLSESRGNEDGVDLMLSLTSKDGPSTIKDFTRAETSSPTNEYINDVFTMPMSLAGLPTLSLPLKQGEAIGLQVIGQYADDATVLDFASKVLDV